MAKGRKYASTLESFLGELRDCSGLLALTETIPKKNWELVDCHRLPGPFQSGEIIHAVCDCGKHYPLDRRGVAPDHSDRLVDELFHRAYRSSREREGGDSWPYARNGVLLQESEFPGPLGSAELPETEELGEGGEDGPEDEPEISDALATYRRMASPGRVSFFMGRIIESFWSQIRAVAATGRHSLSSERVAEFGGLFLKSILYHELFHYFCDVQAYLSGDPRGTFKRRSLEEPLAVAYGRWRISGDLPFRPDLEAYLEKRYDYRRLRWYRNWRDYDGDMALCEGLFAYLPYLAKDELKAHGIHPGRLLLGSIETIIQSPNASLVIWWPRFLRDFPDLRY